MMGPRLKIERTMLLAAIKLARSKTSRIRIVDKKTIQIEDSRTGEIQSIRLVG